MQIRSVLSGVAVVAVLVASLVPSGPATAGPGCTEVPEPHRWADAGTPDQPAAEPLISAHRGAPLLAPENTLWAYRYAFAYDVSTVEVDVRETSDGRYVAFHDDTVDRTTDGTGPVSGLTFNQIRSLNAADYEPWKGGPYDPAQVASVEEVAQLAADVGGGIEFDIKQVTDPAGLVDIAAEYGILEESIFNTADPRVVVGRPEARLIYNRDTFEPPGGLYAMGARYGVFGSRLDEYSAASIAEAHDACGLVMPHAYDRGPENEMSELVAARAMGADGAQVNQPELAADALDRPVATHIVSVAEDSICLTNAGNEMGLPNKPIHVTSKVTPEPAPSPSETPTPSPSPTKPGKGKGRGKQQPTPSPSTSPTTSPEPRIVTRTLTSSVGGCGSFEGELVSAQFDGDGSAMPSRYPADGGSTGPAPRGVHLSFEDARSDGTVVWFTDGTQDPGTTVRYGPKSGFACGPEDLKSRAEGDAVAAPGVDVLSHEASMTELSSGTEICYQVGSQTAWSPVRSFDTGSPEDGFTFAAFADHGIGPNSSATTAAVVAADPDFVVLPGDISYANGNQPIWDDYFDTIEPLASQVPFMVALGNHEVEDNFGTEAFRTRFALPGEETYYSYDYGNVHFVVTTAGAALSEGGLEQELAFIERDLADAFQRRARGEIDFIVMVQHFPIYSNHESRGPCDPALVAIEEQFLQRYQVDLLLSGHNHHFERSKPIVYGHPTTHEHEHYANPQGFIEVITGGGGKSLYEFTDPGGFQGWAAAHARRFHYTWFEVADDVMKVKSITTDAPAGEVLDEWTLRAGEPGDTPVVPDQPNPCVATP